MATSLRRPLSTRNIGLLLQRLSPHSSHVSHICPPYNFNNNPSTRRAPTITINDFVKDSRRSFLKGGKTKDEDAKTAVEVVPSIGLTLKAIAIAQFEAAISPLSQEVSKLPTGRVSAGMLDNIIVETGGLKMPLRRVAVVSVIDSRTLSITPYDPKSLKEVEKAITSSSLGLNLRLRDQRLIADILPLTKEHLQVVIKSCADVKLNIRRVRHKALDAIKNAGPDLPKGRRKELIEEVDELTKKFVKSAEHMCKAKERELAAG